MNKKYLLLVLSLIVVIIGLALTVYSQEVDFGITITPDKYSGTTPLTVYFDIWFVDGTPPYTCGFYHQHPKAGGPERPDETQIFHRPEENAFSYTYEEAGTYRSYVLCNDASRPMKSDGYMNEIEVKEKAGEIEEEFLVTFSIENPIGDLKDVGYRDPITNEVVPAFKTTFGIMPEGGATPYSCVLDPGETGGQRRIANNGRVEIPEGEWAEINYSYINSGIYSPKVVCRDQSGSTVTKTKKMTVRSPEAKERLADYKKRIESIVTRLNKMKDKISTFEKFSEDDKKELLSAVVDIINYYKSISISIDNLANKYSIQLTALSLIPFASAQEKELKEIEEALGKGEEKVSKMEKLLAEKLGEKLPEEKDTEEEKRRKAEEAEQQKFNQELEKSFDTEGLIGMIKFYIKTHSAKIDKLLPLFDQAIKEAKEDPKKKSNYEYSKKKLNDMKIQLKGVQDALTFDQSACIRHNPNWGCRCIIKENLGGEPGGAWDRSRCEKDPACAVDGMSCWGLLANRFCCAQDTLSRPSGFLEEYLPPAPSIVPGADPSENIKKTVDIINGDFQEALKLKEQAVRKRYKAAPGLSTKAQKKLVEFLKKFGPVLENIEGELNKVVEHGEKEKINETEQKKKIGQPSFGCISVNWTGAFRMGRNRSFWPKVDASMWKDYPVTCGYQLTAGLYSLVQAISYTRGSGSCFAEQPLPGTDSCEDCNIPFTECTESRCNILGKCLWIEKEDTSGGVCMPGICEPTAVPMVEIMDARFFIDRTKSWRNFTRIKPPCPFAPPDLKYAANCFEVKQLLPYTVSDIEINISLNQHGKCRYIIDKYNASFEEMTGEFENNQYYPTSQKITIDVTGLELGENHTIYIKCEGACGQSHDPGFDWNFIRFEFEEKPDELPPVIVKLVPDPLTQYISNESTQETIEVWLDEAGFCEYSHVGDGSGLLSQNCGQNLTTKWREGAGLNQSEMCPEPAAEWNVLEFNCSKNTKQCCSPGFPEPTCYDKYECGRCYLKIDPRKGYEEFNWTQIAEGDELTKRIPKTTLDHMKGLGMTGVGKVFTYMFRCSDYPGGNLMHEEDSYMYIIMTYPPFEMNLTEPKNNSHSYEREWNISVETSRSTECRYAVSNISLSAYPAWEDMEEIDAGFMTEHEGMTEELTPSDYFLYVRCRDAGSLEKQDFVKFTVLEDTTAPMAIRLYGWEDYLYIETNEKSDCVYGIVDCAYNFSDGSEMVGNLQYIHSAPWSLDHDYYVKCKDRWGNEPPATKCTIIVSPYEVPEL